MPFFNFRRAGSSTAASGASASQSDSVEVIRKRAKHRLIGASVLVLIGVIGFPLLFDTQPRPIAVDMPIEIPAKNIVKPQALPAKPLAPAPEAVAPVASTPALAPSQVSAASSLGSKEEVVADSKPELPVAEAPPAIKKEAPPASRASPKPEVKVPAKPAATADDAARAKALLNGEAAPVAAAANEARLVVQVGAFSDVNKAREARVKLEKAGLKTYTQVAETPGGKRIRVRVGPFATKAEADKAASKIKSLDLPASILTL